MRTEAMMIAICTFEIAALESETGMPIVVAENPLYSVVLGSGQYLEEAAFKNLISQKPR